jgi:periplasmic divalent cation tolerance protein
MPNVPSTGASDAAATVVLTTVGSEEEAVALVRELLDRRLVACGTLFPGARSLYRWEGRVADEREVVMLLKTTPARLPDLEAAFRERHPYALPELLAVPVSAGLAQYVAWVAAETAATPR